MRNKTDFTAFSLNSLQGEGFSRAEASHPTILRISTTKDN